MTWNFEINWKRKPEKDKRETCQNMYVPYQIKTSLDMTSWNISSFKKKDWVLLWSQSCPTCSGLAGFPFEMTLVPSFGDRCLTMNPSDVSSPGCLHTHQPRPWAPESQALELRVECSLSGRHRAGIWVELFRGKEKGKGHNSCQV